MSLLDPRYRIVHYMDGYEAHYYSVEQWRLWFPFWKIVAKKDGFYFDVFQFDTQEEAIKWKKRLEFKIEHKKKMRKKTVISYIY